MSDHEVVSRLCFVIWSLCENESEMSLVNIIICDLCDLWGSDLLRFYLSLGSAL